jgi:dolichol-phosphate mannosyltransferase
MNLFVVPAFNEEANVPRLLRDLERRPELWRSGRLILVDDGSSDATAAVAEAHAGALPVEVLRQVPNQGPGRAFDRGFRRALELASDGDRIVTLEADTTSDLDALASMLAEAAVGADVVLASVHAGGEMIGVGRTRQVLSRGAARFMRAGAGLDARTVSSFFRVYRAEVLRDAYAVHGERLIREPGFACKAEILMKLAALDARVVEVPVALDASRRVGESKLRVLPTAAGYGRLMARQVATKLRAAA